MWKAVLGPLSVVRCPLPQTANYQAKPAVPQARAGPHRLAEAVLET